MRNVMFQKLPLVIVMVALSLCSHEGFASGKNADDLEEALMMTLLEKRAKKRGNDSDEGSLRLDKADMKYLKSSDDKNEISTVIVNDIKNIIKEPCLNLLASSELITWSELKSRVDQAKRAIGIFEVKYGASLSSGGTVAAPVPTQMPGIVSYAAPAPAYAFGVPTSMPGVKPAGIPNAVMPGTMPGIAPAGMPKTVMPGVAPVAVKKLAADEEEDDEEDETPTKPAVVMPVANKPAGMPVAGQVASGMPIARPAGMPVAVPAQAFGGMPVAVQAAKPAGMPGIAQPQPFSMPVARPMPVVTGMPGVK